MGHSLSSQHSPTASITSETNAPSIEAVSGAWSSDAEGYAMHLDAFTVPLAIQLACHVGAHLPTCSSLLEVGAGAGAGAAYVQMNRLPQISNGNFAHSVTDLVEPMVDMLRKRLHKKSDVRKANAEDLPYDDCTFDAYMASLCLMITPNARAMLADASRVLKPGAKAGFSVWGSKDRSPMFTIPASSLGACGLPTPSKRSNFYLGGDNMTQELRAMVLNAGFSDVYMWRSYIALPGITTPESYLSLMVGGSATVKAMLTPLSPSARAAVEAQIISRAAEIIESGNSIGAEFLLIVAVK